MPRSPELPFSDPQRRGLVQELLEAFERVQADSTPRLVLLEADSGWGKSRIVQEFYREIAARQSTPAYWPASILEAVPPDRQADLGDLSNRRKRIFPESGFPAQPAATPPWFWWGISATASRMGTPIESLATDLKQVLAHGTSLAKRLTEIAGKSPAPRRGPLIKPEELKELGITIATELAGVALSASGLSFIVWAAQLAAHRIGRASEPSDQGGLRFASPEDLADQLADHLGDFAAAGIPVIIAVEDAHEASASLVQFLVRLIEQRRGSILVLATSWPGSYEPTNRLRTEISEPLLDRRALHETHPHLPEEILQEHAGWLLPATDTAQRQALAKQFRNILALETACGLKRVRHLLEAGKLDVDEIRRLPTDLGGLWAEEWNALEEAERDAIYLSILTSPASVGDLFPEAIAWDAALPPLAAGGVVPESDLERAFVSDLDEAVRRAWIRRVNEWMRVCHEPAKFRLAQEKGRQDSSTYRDEAFWRSLAERLDLDPDSDDDARNALRSRLLTALAVQGYAPWNDRSIRAADYVVGTLAKAHDTASLELAVRIGKSVQDEDAERSRGRMQAVARALNQLGDLDGAIAIMEALVAQATASVASLAPEEQPILWLRLRLAHLYRQAEQLDKAIDGFRGLVDSFANLEGSHAAGTLEALEGLATALHRAGHSEEALGIVRQVLATRLANEGSDRRLILETRHKLAGLLSAAGQFPEAIEQVRLIVSAWTEEHGVAHPEVVHARCDLAQMLAQSGHLEQSLTEMESVITDAANFDTTGIATLEPRHDLAKIKKNLGRSHESAALQREVLADRIRLQGANHPDTLHAMIDLAGSLGDVGDAHSAVELVREVVERRRRTHGSLHPKTLEDREVLASWLKVAGDRAAAFAEYEALATDMISTYGSAHPSTLDLRAALAMEIADRSPEEAISAMKAVVSDCRGRWGSNSAQTMRTERKLAALFGILGRDDLAIAELRRLAEACEAALGGLDFRTLEIRHDLAERLVHSGRAGQALGDLQALITARAASQGADHWETFHARSDYARALSQEGQLAAALSEFESLIADAERVFGPDTRHVLDFRHLYADSLVGAGRLEDALREQEALVAARTNLQGAGSPDTLHAIADLAATLARVGQRSRAIAAQRELVERRRETYREEDSDTLDDQATLAGMLGRNGDAVSAVEMLSRVVDIHTRVHGEKDPRTVEAREMRAIWLDDVGEAAEQVREFERILVVRTEIHDGDDPRILETRELLADARGSCGDAEAAAEEYSRIADARVELHGAHDIRALAARRSQAHWLGESGRRVEAMEMLEGLLSTCLSQPGPDQPITIAVQEDLAEQIGLSGDPCAAADAYAGTVEIRRSLFGPTVLRTLEARAAHADWLRRCGAHEQAIEAFRALLADRLETSNPDDPSVLQTRRGLAQAIAEIDPLEAARELIDLLADYKRVYSPGHPQISKTQEHVERVRKMAEEGQTHDG